MDWLRLVILFFISAKLAHICWQKRVYANDVFLLTGGVILYVILQRIPDHKEGFTAGLEGVALNNLNCLLTDLYNGDTLTIPGNVHIKGDLLVGTYKTTPTGTEQSWGDAIKSAYSYTPTPPVVDTGRIYSWNARHMETCTGFICRETGPLEAGKYVRNDIWFMSYDAFKAGATVKQTLCCGDIKCEEAKSIAVDKLSSANLGNMGGNNGSTMQIWSNAEISGGKDFLVSRNLRVDGQTQLEGDVKIWKVVTDTRKGGKGWLFHNGDSLSINYNEAGGR
jgi:hypothetical protein